MKRQRILLISLFITIACFALPTSASIIKRPPGKGGDASYKDLVCTEDQRLFIREIISTMAENSKLNLYFKEKHLKCLGDQLSDVHPYKFMSTIFTDPYLKLCMVNIWDDYFKRNGFMGGLAPNLTREMGRGKLLSYIDEFSADVKVNSEDIRPYFEAQDWEGLVLFLIHS